jgi:hypothetical protein
MRAKSIFRFHEWDTRNSSQKKLAGLVSHAAVVSQVLHLVWEAVDSAERVLVDRLTTDVGGLGLGTETAKGQAVINEPELEKGRRAEPLSMGPHQGQAPAVQFLSCMTSLCYYNYLALLVFGYGTKYFPPPSGWVTTVRWRGSVCSKSEGEGSLQVSFQAPTDPRLKLKSCLQALVSTLRMNGVIHSFLLHATMTCTGKTLSFIHGFKTRKVSVLLSCRPPPPPGHTSLRCECSI